MRLPIHGQAQTLISGGRSLGHARAPLRRAREPAGARGRPRRRGGRRGRPLPPGRRLRAVRRLAARDRRAPAGPRRPLDPRERGPLDARTPTTRPRPVLPAHRALPRAARRGRRVRAGRRCPRRSSDGDVLYVHASPLSDVRSFLPEPARRGRGADGGRRPRGASSSATPTSPSGGRVRTAWSWSTRAASGMPLDGDHRAAYALVDDERTRRAAPRGLRPRGQRACRPGGAGRARARPPRGASSRPASTSIRRLGSRRDLC